jgi:hypothetical protein
VHCPIYNRIMLRPGGLYRRIGLTEGFSTAFTSDATVCLARRVVRMFGRSPKPGLFAKSMRLVKRALELSGAPGQPLLQTGIRKGIYFGTADPRAIDMLRTGMYAPLTRPTAESVVKWWHASLERRRLARSTGLATGRS